MARRRKDQDRPLHELLPPVTLKPMGAATGQENQGNLLAAKQSPAFPVAGGLIAHCLTMRGDRIMLDYTQNAVGVRYEVDGVWVNVDPRDRQSGDDMLAVFKRVANLNAQDRRSRQDGKFGAVFKGTEYFCRLSSQGVKTGERVLFKLDLKKPKLDSFESLGMRQSMRDRYKELIDEAHGLVVLSSLAGGGFSTLWRIALIMADRYVRDFVAIEDQHNHEDEVVNIGPIHYDGKAGQSAATVLPRLLLKQPDVFVVPEFADAKTVEMLCEQVNDGQKMVITRAFAKDAIDAILRILAYKGPTAEVAKALKFVLYSRLIRRLCEGCRQPYQPAPQLLQKLGIPPGRVGVFYKEFQPPPPEQRVDAKGRPIEIEICQKCGGVGYYGRIAIFEMLELDDKVRNVVAKQPNAEAIRRAAHASGHASLQDEGILLVVQGITSLQELQRVLKQ